MTLHLSMFISNLIFLKNLSVIFNIAYSYSLELLIKIIYSANKSIGIYLSKPNFNPNLFLTKIELSSSITILNNSGLIGHPYLTPILVFITFDKPLAP